MTQKKLDSLAILSAMSQAQQQQFMAATTLVIGTIMRKCGLSELSITPEDVDAIAVNETLRIEPLANGGFSYRFVERPSVEEALGEQPLDKPKRLKKLRTTHDGAKRLKSPRKMP